MKPLRLVLIVMVALLVRAWSPAVAADGIPTRGGAVMHAPTIYPIFWIPGGRHFHGTGSTLTDTNFENEQMQFLLDLSGSSYYRILTQYTDKKGPVAPTFTVVNPVVDLRSYPYGRGSVKHPLLRSDIDAQVVSIAGAEGWKNVPGASLFLVYTPMGVQVCSSDPAPKTRCSVSPKRPKKSYLPRCAYHQYFTSNKQKWVDALVSTEGLACSEPWQSTLTATTAPNGDVEGDMAIDFTAHEVAEAVTDPFSNAWIATDLTEVADKCETQIGSIDGNGGDVLISRDSYLIQTLWSNADQKCELAPGT